MTKRNKIIYYPRKMSKYRHGIEFLLKILLSAAAFLMTAALWSYYGGYLYGRLFSESYFAQTVEILGKLFIVAFFAFLAMLFWQQYNVRVFGGRNRRRLMPPFPDDALAACYNLDVKNVKLLRQSKYIRVQEDGERMIWHTDAATIVSGFFIGERPPEKNKAGLSDR
jgi:poly-beta-1,6-N-acetyl-D-glucosamine biosynthesis protein PgaD